MGSLKRVRSQILFGAAVAGAVVASTAGAAIWYSRPLERAPWGRLAPASFQPAPEVALAVPPAFPAASPPPAVAEAPRPNAPRQSFGGLAAPQIDARLSPIEPPADAPKTRSLSPVVASLAPATAPLDEPAGVPANVPLPPSAPPRDSFLTPIIPLPPARPPESRTVLPPGPPPAATSPILKTTPAPTPAAVAPSDTARDIARLPDIARPPDTTILPPGPSGSFAKGQAAFVRIFKKEGELELWLKRGPRYSLYKTFSICKWSGKLGPKVKNGDYQAPEGFYSVTARQLNPNSQYHLAFNVGYPNAYDRQHGRTGSALMVHGECASVGCYAMTNKGIEEIYGYVEAALRGGQREVPVHIFPFRMSEREIVAETGGALASLFGGGGGGSAQWGDFWRNLKEGYDIFERTGEPPTAYACNRRYVFGAAGGNCARIAGW